jgi:hypothetical protein
MFKEPSAYDVSGTEYQKNEPAHYGRRKHQREGKYDVYDSFDQTGKSGNIMRGGNAGKEDNDRGYEGNSERIEKRVPIHRSKPPI